MRYRVVAHDVEKLAGRVVTEPDHQFPDLCRTVVDVDRVAERDRVLNRRRTVERAERRQRGREDDIRHAVDAEPIVRQTEVDAAATGHVEDRFKVELALTLVVKVERRVTHDHGRRRDALPDVRHGQPGTRPGDKEPLELRLRQPAHGRSVEPRVTGETLQEVAHVRAVERFPRNPPAARPDVFPRLVGSVRPVLRRAVENLHGVGRSGRERIADRRRAPHVRQTWRGRERVRRAGNHDRGRRPRFSGRAPDREPAAQGYRVAGFAPIPQHAVHAGAVKVHVAESLIPAEAPLRAASLVAGRENHRIRNGLLSKKVEPMADRHRMTADVGWKRVSRRALVFSIVLPPDDLDVLNHQGQRGVGVKVPRIGRPRVADAVLQNAVVRLQGHRRRARRVAPPAAVGYPEGRNARHGKPVRGQVRIRHVGRKAGEDDVMRVFGGRPVDEQRVLGALRCDPQPRLELELAALAAPRRDCRSLVQPQAG